jgi:hypothetical protein
MCLQADASVDYSPLSDNYWLAGFVDAAFRQVVSKSVILKAM